MNGFILGKRGVVRNEKGRRVYDENIVCLECCPPPKPTRKITVSPGERCNECGAVVVMTNRLKPSWQTQDGISLMGAAIEHAKKD
jgi:hypothetical protein